jgi:predicted enzyme related to lactoylglutathione lyase
MDLGKFEVALPTADLDRIVSFYEGVGFVREGGDIEVGVAELRRGDCRLCFYKGQLDPDRMQLIFWQGDVDAIASQAEAAGIPFFRELKTAEDGGGAFMLVDPDGNPLFFIYMPVHFVNHPGHEQVAPPREPTRPLDADPALGWFELSLPVADIRRSFEFYQKLGYRRVRGSLEQRHVTLQNRDSRIALLEGFLQPPDEPQLIFWQGDVHAEAKALADQGAALVDRFKDGPVTSAEGHVALFARDPDGQPIYLINIPGEALGQRAPA